VDGIELSEIGIPVEGAVHGSETGAEEITEGDRYTSRTKDIP